MADQSEKQSGPRLSGEMVWYAIPVGALVLFFGWVLWEMGSQSAGGTLVRLLLGIVIVLVGSGVIFVALNRLRRNRE